MNAIKLLPLPYLLSVFYAQSQSISNPKPNILWIVSEDNSARFVGCYGNTYATTPNIDKLANQGFMYSRAYCPNAVCAPSRNCILTGIYACSNGNENMRSSYSKSNIVKTYPEYFRNAGYYCTNNQKTDYNFENFETTNIWDDCSKKAHYKNRPKDKPFFAVFNIEISHEGKNHSRIANLRHDPTKVVLPPYSPDIPEMRHDWAQYYDLIENMDMEVGAFLKELEENGEAQNTIVMYYGDNGGILPRSKRFIYETGTHIPFIVRIPEKFNYLYPAEKPGQKVDRIINFVDIVPTLLSIIETPIPSYLQGKAFLGKQKTSEPMYTFMSRQRMDERYDLVRAVRDKRFRYIHNYMPFRITMQHIEYLFKAPSANAWEKLFMEGKTNPIQSFPFQLKPVEELYDTENDPWEVNNLASNPAYNSDLLRMRQTLNNWMRDIKDVGLIPERDYKEFAGNGSMYDYMRSSNCPFDELLQASDVATLGNKKNINTFISYLKSPNNAIRYWGITGLLILKNEAKPALSEIINATNDKSGFVATLAAETLYGIGEKKLAFDTYLKILNSNEYNSYDIIFALNSIDAINETSDELKASIVQLSKNALNKKTNPESYIAQNYNYLLQKWNLKVTK